MQIDVSVVVPVYNTELYLRKCIASLIHQTLRNVEFIFVDDGSTDRSVEIIEKVKKKDKRISLIKQHNQYAGVARNNGMKVASGKYIIFLDSDDFFEHNLLEEAFNCAEKHKAEITVFGYSTYDNKKKLVRHVPFADFPSGVFSIEYMEQEFIYRYSGVPWNKLFLRTFIDEKGLQFQSVKKHNDTYFTHMAAYSAQRIVYLKKRLVYYRCGNSESLQGDFNRDRAAFLKSQLAIRSRLIQCEMFYGVRKKAYQFNLKKLIHVYGEINDTHIDSIKQYYFEVRDALIPGLFDAVNEFEEDSLVMLIYEGDLESFLLYQANGLSREIREMREMREALDCSMVSKSSKDYLIGHSLLIVPRRMKRLIEYIFREKDVQD